MKLINSGFLKDVMLVTRYCDLEQPYWESFINHYFSLGVRNIHVCLQGEVDLISVNQFKYPTELNLIIHNLPEDYPPDIAWTTINFEHYTDISKYILAVDCDEFLYSLNPIVTLDDLMTKKSCMNIRWLMNPVLNPIKPTDSGFWGPASKQLAVSQEINKLYNPHRFVFKNAKKANKEKRQGVFYGLVIIHNWARSINDSLIKTLGSKIKDEKQADQNSAISNIESGHLTYRGRYLAFLDLQRRYLNGLDTSYMKLFSLEKEKEILLNYTSLENINKYHELFYTYREILAQKIHFLPSFPPVKGNLKEQLSTLVTSPLI